MADFVNPFGMVPLHDLLCAWEEAGYDAGPPPECADEGWWLFHSDTYGVEIERDDEAENPFTSDDDALAYVRARAEAGSPLHQQALAIHEAQEAQNRAFAEAAGYTVRLGFSQKAGKPPLFMVWGWVPPGETRVRYAGETQTAAWSAAWRDLLERGGADD